VLTNLDEAKTPEKQAMWEAALIYAQARLTAAETKLDAKVRSYDTEEVAIKKLEVELAKQSLELTQQTLKQAEQSLDYARKRLDEATLTAPFDGVVASVYAKEGDMTSSPDIAPKTIIYLIDLASMELEVEVDEIDIPRVKLGQQAIISVDALPDVQLKGEVASISLLAKEEGGVITYKIKISLTVPQGSGLKAGMSATADIVTEERRGVLLVPSRAIKQDSQGNTMVEVMVGEQTQERQVVTGISDGMQTEIVDGLKEGEVVVVAR
jgi:HlyD family secretion protein